MYPRYFAPGAPDARPLPTPPPAAWVQLRDAFRLRETPVWVVCDVRGLLHVVPAGPPGELPEPMRSQLVHRELAGTASRTIDAGELWLFDPQVVDQPVNTPGINDPVHLWGRLCGPFGTGFEATAIDGTLTVTRADVLAGLIDELPWAFRATTGGEVATALHLLLPADTVEAVAAGNGIVLAWPSIPAELDAHDIANEPLCASLLFDLLAAMQADLRAIKPDAPFARRTLPVPSRAELERELERDGWEVRGDRAVRLADSLKRGVGSLLTSVLGVPDAMTRTLPPEGRLDDFVKLAAEVLAEVPDWPDARARALRQRVRASRTAPIPSPPVEPRIPARSGDPLPTNTATVATPTRAARRPDPPSPPAGPPAWQADFSTPPSRPDVRRSTVRAPEVPARRTPDWMKDFE